MKKIKLKDIKLSEEMMTADQLSNDLSVKNLSANRISCDTSVVYSDCAQATGENCVSGTRAFRIKHVDKDNRKFYLNTVEGIEIGLEYSARFVGAEDKFGNVVDIDSENNTITLDKIPDIEYVDPLPDYTGDTYMVWFIDKPSIGDSIRGNGAHAEGYKSKALSVYSHAEGEECVAFGKYAHAEGMST